MAWIKVPPEHHPLFLEALPRDLRIHTLRMFGGIGAMVNGHLFAGLFARSAIVQLPEPLRTEAMALEGAGPFDPRGDGSRISNKVMLPESLMEEPDELRLWIARAFEAAAQLPPKVKPSKGKKKAPKPKARRTSAKPTAAAAKHKKTR